MSVGQGFVEWSPPPILFSDLRQHFTPFSSDFPWWQRFPPVIVNKAAQSSSSVGENPYSWQEENKKSSVIRDDHNDYEILKPKPQNQHTTVSALALWLAVLGTARAQSVPADTDTPPFSTLYKWRIIDFEFPSQRHRRHAVETGKYIPENVMPLGLEVYKSRVFVSLPSWRPGVPATLATVPRSGGLPSPPLKPYPSWDLHRAFGGNSNCTGLTSVFRMNVDKCGRLWVLDSGQIDSQDSPKQICPPSIVLFDLETDTVTDRFPIPKELVLQDSLFSNIVVDSSALFCSDVHAYIADTWRFGLIVFRLNDKRFWRFTNPFFYPDPLASNYNLHGLHFQWADGIFGLALSADRGLGWGRYLFFHSMSSYREFCVKTEVLQNPERVNSSANEFKLLGESRGPFGHSSASAVDNNGIMFYGLVTRDAIGCWNSKKPYRRRFLDLVARNHETLVFPNDLKIDQFSRHPSLWVISNRLPMFQAQSLNPLEYNYRLLYADTSEAVRGTACDPDLLNQAVNKKKYHYNNIG